jgi:hypothetical protein
LNARSVFQALLPAFFWSAAHASYIDEAQCFGPVVPSVPTGLSASANVFTPQGIYLATAWRQDCPKSPGAGVLLIRFQAVTGSPSISSLDVTVSQAGLTFSGSMLLVKNPAAQLLIDFAQFGTFGTVSTILKQYSGARFDPNGRLTIQFLDSGAGQTQMNLAAAPTAPASASVDVSYGNYSDMWWNPAENGTGLSIVQHGSNQLFIVWYTYNDSGEPLWLVWSGGTWLDNKTFSGTLYQTRGTSFRRQWDPAAFVLGNPAGTAQIRFDAADMATLSYSIGASTGQKTFTRLGY